MRSTFRTIYPEKVKIRCDAAACSKDAEVIEYVRMEKQQRDAYNESIENYCASSQIANHLLLVRRIYSDDDVVHFAKILHHPKGAFGFEYTLERVIEAIHRHIDDALSILVFFYLLLNTSTACSGILTTVVDLGVTMKFFLITVVDPSFAALRTSDSSASGFLSGALFGCSRVQP
ncbi:hypothetical protein OROHE_022260 [Orobanche hederae]